MRLKLASWFTAASTVAFREDDVRVFLVDEHPITQRGVRALLEVEAGIAVVGGTDDADVALRMAREHRIDLVIKELMPVPWGAGEMTRRLREQNPSTHVLVLSMNEDVRCVRQMLDAGAEGYLSKRSGGDHLARAARVVASGGQYIEGRLAGLLLVRKPSLLSRREAEVLRLISQGHTAKEIAHVLGLSPRTLETYRVRAIRKLGINTRTDLMRHALRSGWLGEGMH